MTNTNLDTDQESVLVVFEKTLDSNMVSREADRCDVQ
jgi:hypothetical protein